MKKRFTDEQMIGIRHMPDHIGHLRVLPASVAEIDQLVIQVPSWFSRYPRKEAIIRGPSFFAMAGGTSNGALCDRVRNLRLLRLDTLGARCKDGCEACENQHDAACGETAGPPSVMRTS